MTAPVRAVLEHVAVTCSHLSPRAAAGSTDALSATGSPDRGGRPDPTSSSQEMRFPGVPSSRSAGIWGVGEFSRDPGLLSLHETPAPRSDSGFTNPPACTIQLCLGRSAVAVAAF